MGTTVLHLGMMAYMNWGVKLSAPYVPIGKIEKMVVALEDKPIELITQEEALRQQQLNGQVSNQTVNETDKANNNNSGEKYDARGYKNLDSDVENDLKNFEKNAFDELASKRKKDDVVVQDENPKKNNQKTDSKGTGEGDKGSPPKGRVSGSYDLDGRVHENFAKPAYVCKGSGTVLLKVKVNHNGKVTSATIDQSSSNYSEECMGANAVTYALKCKFEASTKWPNPQEGTITYTYVSQ